MWADTKSSLYQRRSPKEADRTDWYGRKEMGNCYETGPYPLLATAIRQN